MIDDDDGDDMGGEGRERLYQSKAKKKKNFFLYVAALRWRGGAGKKITAARQTVAHTRAHVLYINLLSILIYYKII